MHRVGGMGPYQACPVVVDNQSLCARPLPPSFLGGDQRLAA